MLRVACIPPVRNHVGWPTRLRYPCTTSVEENRNQQHRAATQLSRAASAAAHRRWQAARHCHRSDSASAVRGEDTRRGATPTGGAAAHTALPGGDRQREDPGLRRRPRGRPSREFAALAFLISGHPPPKHSLYDEWAAIQHTMGQEILHQPPHGCSSAEARNRCVCRGHIATPCLSVSKALLWLVRTDYPSANAQGFRDDAYKRRRVAIADLARDHVV